MLNVNEYVRKFFRLNDRYNSSFRTIKEDIDFFKHLCEAGKYEEAHFFYLFCVDAYGHPATSDWGKDRDLAAGRDIFSATQQQLMLGDE